MPLIAHILVFLTLSLTFVLGIGKQASASHIIGGEITWACQGNGTYIFYLKLYRDCTQSTPVNVIDSLLVANHPSINVVLLTLQSQQDITQPGCGVSCLGAGAGDVAVEEFIFASAPITLGAVPPANGFIFRYNRCCRNSVTNMVGAENYTINYRAVMYPLSGLDSNPCYDSSPQFAENPSALLCSGYQLSYNSNAIDADGDSLTYSFVSAAHEAGTVPYAAGYSFDVPLPGPTLDPSYDLVTIDPITGQIEYNAPGVLQGKWNIAYVVRAFRCGQLISENVREMQVWIIPCSDPNNTPVVNAPTWIAPAGTTGYNLTVQAGELVSFTLDGVDNDIVNGVPQVLTFEAVGSQFGANFSNANAGCQTPPCATLSNSTPPVSLVGNIGTTFTWQTSCEHVAVLDQCANYSNTYNFIFKYLDDYCPARSTKFVNVSVTVIGEAVLPSPEPHCATVLPGGGVALSWAPIVDNAVPPSFVEYAILHSLNPNGPFTEVGTVANINTGTYTHAGASSTGPNYYQIRTRSGCNGAILSPAEYTISSIFLTLANNLQTADLSWNDVTTPPLPSSNGNGQGLYQIFKEYPVGTWTQIGTTFGFSWSDPVTVCSEQVNYYVQLTDNLPCISTSNIVGDVLNNPAPPSIQYIDSVTVDLATQMAFVGWSPNSELNVVAYIIQKNPNLVAWTTIDTSFGYLSNGWLNLSSNAQNESEYYRILALNNCGVDGLPGDLYQRTIFLEVLVDTCNQATSLTWNPYEIWQNGVREYEILVSKDGGAEEKVGITADTVLTFVHTELDQLATYCYRVRAVQNAPSRITSTSNQACVFMYVPKRPDYSYQYNVTVNSTSDAIEQYFFIDSTAGYVGFDILRGTTPDDLSAIDFVDWNPNSRYYQFTDNFCRPKSLSYYYAAVGIDSCDQNADTLHLSRTILLRATANSDRTNDLSWNAYEGWLGSVAAQNIWRNYDGAYELIATVPPSQLTYTDPIEEFITGEGEFCYYIEALEGSGPFISPDGVRFMEISRSNEDCALQLPNVFVPNAFAPEGVNTVFLPVTVYVDYSDYVFEVYNRWGELIFSTTNPLRGWTGIIDGELAPQGAYGYHIRFVSSTGGAYQKSGTVTLIR